MRGFLARCCLAAALCAGAHSQMREPVPLPQRKLPNGKSQAEEILKADHARDMKDVDALIEAAQQLKRELEKNDRHVLSVASIRKTEEIEKLARRIRSRLRRF
ncbi:MAG: hypothetical protein ACE15B_23865 [Bryobacteraceae bacterium]